MSHFVSRASSPARFQTDRATRLLINLRLALTVVPTSLEQSEDYVNCVSGVKADSVGRVEIDP